MLNYFKLMMDDAEAMSDTAALHSDCLNTVLRQAARRMTHIYDIALAPTGLNAAQARLAAVVAELDDPAGQGPALQDVARRLGLEVSALTHALRPLERDGVLTVTRGLVDGRTRHARLTAQGAAKLGQALQMYVSANQRIAAVLGPDQTADLLRLAGEVLTPGFADKVLAKG